MAGSTRKRSLNVHIPACNRKQNTTHVWNFVFFLFLFLIIEFDKKEDIKHTHDISDRTVASSREG